MVLLQTLLFTFRFLLFVLLRSSCILPQKQEPHNDWKMQDQSAVTDLLSAPLTMAERRRPDTNAALRRSRIISSLVILLFGFISLTPGSVMLIVGFETDHDQLIYAGVCDLAIGIICLMCGLFVTGMVVTGHEASLPCFKSVQFIGAAHTEYNESVVSGQPTMGVVATTHFQATEGNDKPTPNNRYRRFYVLVLVFVLGVSSLAPGVYMFVISFKTEVGADGLLQKKNYGLLIPGIANTLLGAVILCLGVLYAISHPIAVPCCVTKNEDEHVIVGVVLHREGYEE